MKSSNSADRPAVPPQAKDNLEFSRDNRNKGLVSSTWHNLCKSVLHKLPDELLLDIMRRLDPVDLFCLRRASALFLRLFSSFEFSQFHRTDNQHFKGPWAAQLVPEGDVWFNMWSRLRKDFFYCDDCRQARLDPGYQARVEALHQQNMHCSGCRCHHPALLFSSSQRKEVNSEKRVCIGHEGFIRLCEHKTQSIGPLLRQPCPEYPTASEFRDKIGFQSRCYNQSHLPEHYRSPVFGRLLNMLPSQRRSMLPTLIIEPGVSEPEGHNWYIKATITQSVHVDLTEMHSKSELTGDAVKRCSGLLRAGASRFIAPEDLQLEKRCLDYAQCTCFNHHPWVSGGTGTEASASAWQLPSSSAVTCPKHRARVHLFSRGEDDDTISLRLAWYRRSKNIYLQGTYCREILLDYAEGIYLRRAENPIRRGGFWTSQRSEDRAGDYLFGRVPYGWYQALDPDSYGLTQDEDTRGILWCRNRGCTNHYAHLREGLVPTQRLNLRCPSTCPHYHRWY